MLLPSALVVALLLIALLAGWLLWRWHSQSLAGVQQRLDAVLRASTDAVSLEDLDGVVQHWSPGAEALLGYTAQETCGRALAFQIPADRVHEETAVLTQLGPEVHTLKTLLRHKNGSLVPVSMALVALLDAEGRRTGVVRVLRDTTRSNVSAEFIQSMAFNDVLTGLPNWRLLRDRIWRAQLNSGRQHSYFAVLYVDVDNFKAINAAQGQAVADQLLVEVSVRLMAAIRQNDTVARLQGDEFVVLLEDLGADEPFAAHHVNTVADKIWDMLERDYLVAGLHLHCTASIGIQLLLGGNGSVDQIIQAADAAMMRVKQGRQSLARGVF